VAYEPERKEVGEFISDRRESFDSPVNAGCPTVAIPIHYLKVRIFLQSGAREHALITAKGPPMLGFAN
jgi:hypothetical protein